LSGDRHGLLKLWMISCGDRSTHAPYMICWDQNRQAVDTPVESV
jgi:hypothetical protein